MLIQSSNLNEDAAHILLKSCVIPRPIAWVATVNENGLPNLAPFSCFSFVATDPPMISFSIGRKVTGKKDTLLNIECNNQFVVNVVSFQMAEKVNGSAKEFPSNVSEFSELGLVPVPSHLVKPPRVQGCPVQMECKLVQIVELGKSRHSLVIGEVILFHVDDKVYQNGEINPRLLDPLARLSGETYAGLGEVLEISRSQ